MTLEELRQHVEVVCDLDFSFEQDLGFHGTSYRVNLRTKDGGTADTAEYRTSRQEAFEVASDMAAKRDARREHGQ